MQTSKILIAFALAIAVLVSQVGAVFAAAALDEGTISGKVAKLVCEIDPLTGIKTFLVTVQFIDNTSQTVRLDQLTADTLGLITLTPDGSPDCSPEALRNARGMEVTIDSTDIIQNEEEALHPVGDALATFFEEIADHDTLYEAIMRAHDENGFGFGIIAQALWLTLKVESSFPELTPGQVFQKILDAKQSGDFSEFASIFGSTPQNWGQFRKAVLDGAKKNNLGVVMSDKDEDYGNNGDGNGQGQGNSNNHRHKNKNNEQGNNGQNEDKGNGPNK